MIEIKGQIGRGKDEPVGAGITLLEIVPVVKTELDKGVKELLLGILSPGGYLEQGNDIYNYFDSLKAQGIKINTTTITDPATGRGLVGSIATKLYLLGEDRSIDPEKDDFFIHYPWMNPGPSDAQQLFESAEIALAEQEKLTEFYCKATNNTKEALAPFLSAETSLTGRQAKDFGFATSFKTNNIVSNLLAKVKMKNEKTLAQLFAGAIEKITGQKPVTPVKAQIKNKKGAVMADVQVTDAAGTGYFIDNDTVTDLSQVMSATEPCAIYLANPDGTPTTTPAPDGDITTGDGYVITVSKGVITNVKQSSDMENKALTAKLLALENEQKEIKVGIEKLISTIETAFKAPVSAEAVTKQINDTVLALKKEIGSNHVPKRTNQERMALVKSGLKGLSPIQLKMRYPNGVPAEVKKLLDEIKAES